MNSYFRIFHNFAISKGARSTPRLSAVLIMLACGPHSLAIDSDNDGITADWEQWRGFSDANPSDALLDWDGDGLTNLLEFITQGRPCGSYDLKRFNPLSGTPTINTFEYAAANRSGELIVNAITTAGNYSFLWTPVPAAGLASQPVLSLPLQVELAPGTFLFNDAGDVVYSLSNGWSSGPGEKRNVRNWGASPVAVTWSTATGEIPVALSNSGKILMQTSGTYYWTPLPQSPVSFDTNFYFGYHLMPVCDSVSGAWFLDHYYGWRLPDEGGPVAFTTTVDVFGSSFTNAGITAVAAGCAIGEAWSYGSSGTTPILFHAGGAEVIGGLSGSANTELFGVSDRGTVIGWDWLSLPSGTQFLWKQVAVPLATAIPAASGAIVASGITGAGLVYGYDYGVSPAQPVVFSPLPGSVRDGASEEGGQLADADADGIADGREAVAGSSASFADTDGDGRGDLWELLTGSSPNVPAPGPSAPGSHTGLAVYSPGSSPLLRMDQLP